MKAVLRSACRRSPVARVAARRSPTGASSIRPRPAAASPVASASEPTTERSSSSPALVAAVQQLIAECSRLAAGYGICARRARAGHVADVGGSLSTLHRAVSDELAAFLVAVGASVPRTKPSCSERLRWEWLASTGRLMGGAPERPVLAECARIEQVAEAHVVTLRDEAAELGLVALRQVVTLLQRARAASLRLAAHVETSSAPLTTT